MKISFEIINWIGGKYFLTKLTRFKDDFQITTMIEIFSIQDKIYIITIIMVSSILI